MNYMHYLRLSLIIVLISTFTPNTVTAQKEFTVKERLDLKEARSAFFNGAYEDAKELYLELFNNHNSNAKIACRIGQCYYELGEFEEALKYFDEVNEGMVDKSFYEFFFYHGAALQKAGKYKTALEQFEKFNQKAKKKDRVYYDSEKYLQQCQYAVKAIYNPVTVQIQTLSDSINSEYDDYHPSISADGSQMVFTSRRDGSTGGDLAEDDQYYEDIYTAEWNDEIGEWGAAKQAAGVLNTKEWDGNTSISPDGNTMYVYRNITSENNKMFSSTGGGDIYTSEKNEAGKWSAPKLFEALNTSFYDGGACISNDGKTIFFISDRFGLLHGKSVGGKDIWTSSLQEDGTWSKPENLGDVINTEEDEISVFIHPNGKTLFFASAGHSDQNFGGYDIFKSELKNGLWTAPVNLGYPINTFRDEKEFILSTDGKVAWISSNGTVDEKKSHMDIYQVDLEYYNVLTGESNEIAILKGVLKDASTSLPLRGEIKFINTATNEVTTVKTDKDGNYFRTILGNTPYKIEVSLDGYRLYTQNVQIDPPKKEKPKRRKRSRGEEELPKTTQTHTVKRNLEVERENPIQVVSKDLFKLQSIRFEKTVEGYTINEFSKGILEMYAQQLVAAPEVAIELTAHFDNSVPEEEAKEKSEMLAEIVRQFIESKGGDKKRIKVVAVGSGYPVADNDNESGRAANRRIDIRIIL